MNQPQRTAIESDMARLLADMFEPGELYRFIRHELGSDLVDALPAAAAMSREEFAAGVARKLVDRGMLGVAFFDALTTVRRDRMEEIRSLARWVEETRMFKRTAPMRRDRDGEMRELRHKLKRAQAYKMRLEAQGGDTREVIQQIVTLKRLLRPGGRLQAWDTLQDGRYELVNPVGRGGFATVWRALDRSRNNLEVAIKVLHGNLAHEPIRRGRFFRGARIMTELAHPGVIRVLQPYGEDDENYYFVMELARGGTLRTVVLDGRLTLDHRISLILHLGQALSAAHKRGYVHRDVKPANILMTESGEAKLTDFDLVAAVDTTGGTRTGALGTFVYAAPEQLDRPQDADARADIYSLAMTALFVMHGRELPITVMRDATAFVRQQKCSRAVMDALECALRWDPNKRFPAMNDFCEAIQRAAKTPHVPRGRAAGQRHEEKSVRMALVWVPAGRFRMGSRHGDKLAHASETPARDVVVEGYWMAATPTTNSQYERWVRASGREPSFWRDRRYNGAEQPVVGVTWYEAVAYCNFLSHQAGLVPCYELHGSEVRWHRAVDAYRLPTEAEWEYACRAGTQTRWSFGHDETRLAHHAWYCQNADNQPQSVARNRANPWGLYDMHGNVSEWCWDVFATYSLLTDGLHRNPAGPEAIPGDVSVPRILRGGCFEDDAKCLRSAFRIRSRPRNSDRCFGFRCARGALREL